MSDLTVYLYFPGTAEEALTFYQGVFGGDVGLNRYEEMNRTDGPADAIGHGMLTGPVTLFAADATRDEETVHMVGMSLTLLGTADADTMRGWFEALSDGGSVIDPLQRRPWGDFDGQVQDRYGLRWLLGFAGA